MAGRDGFWLHRLLTAHGIAAYVLEPASILVNRRARRAKTDRLDAEGMLRVLATGLTVAGLSFFAGSARARALDRPVTQNPDSTFTLMRGRGGGGGHGGGGGFGGGHGGFGGFGGSHMMGGFGPRIASVHSFGDRGFARRSFATRTFAGRTAFRGHRAFRGSHFHGRQRNLDPL
jgi:hypothetical protein